MKEATIRTYYTYLWLRPDGTPFYAGKGFRTSRRRGRAYRKGSPPEEYVIVQDHESEDQALFAECFLISFYGREDLGTGCLRNFTDGGEGACGSIRSEDHKRKISIANKGKQGYWLGKNRGQSFKDILSQYRKANPIQGYDPTEHSKKMTGSGNPMFGKKRVFDEQWRARLSAGKMGHSVSDETKRKMREKRVAYWAKRRESCQLSSEL